MRFYTFNLTKLPLYYVAGLYQGTRPWIRKELIQPGNYSIIIVLHGIVYLSIENKQFQIKSNQFLLVPPFKKAIGYRPIPQGTSYIWIHFFPQGEIKTWSNFQVPGRYQCCLSQYGTLNNPTLVIIKALEFINLKNQVDDYYLSLGLGQLLLLIGNNTYHKFNEDHHSNSKNTLVKRVNHYLVVHFLDIKHLSDLIGIYGFSIPYLNRQFKAVYHQSLYQYLIHLRLNYARQLLILTNEPIYIVAHRSHFPDSKNFTRLFKQRMGTTPSNYRQIYNHYRMATPTYDPVIPVSDSIMKHLIREGLLKSPKHPQSK